MKNSKKNKSAFHSFLTRFSAGLVIALAFTFTAFEWTTITTNAIIEPPLDYNEDSEIMLPPITYRTERIEKPKPKEKSSSDQLDIIKDFIEQPTDKNDEISNEKPSKAELQIIDPNEYFEREVFEEEDKIFEGWMVEIFAHYDQCSELLGNELAECSKLDIQNRVKQNFKVSPQLRNLEGKQAALVSMVVGKDGEISSIEIVQSTSKAMSKASIKAFEQLPKMNPASQRGRKVSLRMTIPIVLRIR